MEPAAKILSKQMVVPDQSGSYPFSRRRGVRKRPVLGAASDLCRKSVTAQRTRDPKIKTKTIPRAKEGRAVTRDEAWKLANAWVAAWNAHDLDLIMSHYDDAVELTSPAAIRLLDVPDGKVAGKENLRKYFRLGLEAYPQLRFRLEDVLYGINSVVLYYTNHRWTRTAEFMELSPAGKVIRVVANYSG
jgi:predicted ester cyclase